VGLLLITRGGDLELNGDKGNGRNQPPPVDFPTRGIITTGQPIRTEGGEFTAFFASTWIRLIQPNGMVDSWVVTRDRGGKRMVVLMIPVHLITGFIATNRAGGESIYDADKITLIEIA
jgi:hypothetical protein